MLVPLSPAASVTAGFHGNAASFPAMQLRIIANHALIILQARDIIEADCSNAG
jgi:hypothetical protein